MAETKLAAPELAGIEIHGVTRGAFIMKGALAAGAVYGAGAVAPFVSTALAKGGDLEILNFALTLEYLEAAFYKKGKTLTLPAEAKKLVTLFGEQEATHVSALTQAIKGAGGTPVKEPKVSFPVNGPATFLKLAVTFEDTGVSAYNGAATMISSPDVLATAGTIVQVEARHAAAIRLLNGQAPAPNGFDKPLEMAAVLKAVKPFIKG
jgi:rubrerythrin